MIVGEYRLGGLTFKAVHRAGVVRDERVFGRINWVTQEIEIDPDLHIDQQEETLLRGIIECVNDAHDLGLAHSAIKNLAHSLHNILKTNKIYFGGYK